MATDSEKKLNSGQLAVATVDDIFIVSKKVSATVYESAWVHSKQVFNMGWTDITVQAHRTHNGNQKKMQINNLLQDLVKVGLTPPAGEGSNERWGWTGHVRADVIRDKDGNILHEYFAIDRDWETNC